MSGHRRHDIGAQLNYPIPTIIVQADDDTARIAVVDGNLHRMDISVHKSDGSFVSVPDRSRPSNCKYLRSGRATDKG